MSESFRESVVEQAALAWLESVGCEVKNGANLPRCRAAAKGFEP